jgi:hypothetical protein
MHVAETAAAAARDEQHVAVVDHLADKLSGALVVNLRSAGDLDIAVTSRAPVTLFAAPVLAALGALMRFVIKIEERGLILAGHEIDVAAAAAVAAVGPAFVHVFFAAKRTTSVAAVAGVHVSANPINKRDGFHRRSFSTKLGAQATVAERFRKNGGLPENSPPFKVRILAPLRGG